MKKARIFFATAALLVAFAAVFATKRATVTGNIYDYNPATGMYSSEGFISNLMCSTGGSGCLNPMNGQQRYWANSMGQYIILRKDL